MSDFNTNTSTAGSANVKDSTKARAWAESLEDVNARAWANALIDAECIDNTNTCSDIITSATAINKLCESEYAKEYAGKYADILLEELSVQVGDTLGALDELRERNIADATQVRYSALEEVKKMNALFPSIDLVSSLINIDARYNEEIAFFNEEIRRARLTVETYSDTRIKEINKIRLLTAL